MIIFLMKKNNMGLRKEVVCFCLLVLVLIMVIFILSTSSYSDVGFAKFGSFKTGFASETSPFESSSEGFVGRNKGVGNINDSSFGDAKRRIHTGPNPLHNSLRQCSNCPCKKF